MKAKSSNSGKKQKEAEEKRQRYLLLQSHCKVFRIHGEPYVGFIHPQLQLPNGKAGEKETIEEEFIMILTKETKRLQLQIGLLNHELPGDPFSPKEIKSIAEYVAQLSQRGREEGNGKPRARSYKDKQITVYADKEGVWEVPWGTGIPVRKGWKDTPFFIPTVCQRRMEISIAEPDQGYPLIHQTIRLFSPPAGEHAGRLLLAFICTLHSPSVVSPGVLAIGKTRTGKSTLARLTQAILGKRTTDARR